MRSGIISSSLLFVCISLLFHTSSAQVWQLNETYALNLSNFATLEADAWSLEQYPGSQAFLITGQAFSDVSLYLCFLSSPSAASPGSSSFTLSMYMVASSIVYRGAVLWSANRATPIRGKDMSLTLRRDGNLVLLGQDPNVPVWTSNTSNRDVSSMELSMNPASLILYTRNRTIVWQSADDPSDTLTMTQSLLSGKKLVSWGSPSDPSPGTYALVMEPGGLALYSSMPDPLPYWVWGFYGFNDTFSVKHTCDPRPLSTFMNPEGGLLMMDYIGKTDNASYWPPFCSLPTTVSTLPFRQYGTAASVSLSNLTFLQLGSDGNLRAYALGSVWSTQFDLFESDTCRLPNICGPYGVCTSGSQCGCPANASAFVHLDSSRPSLGCRPVNNLTCSPSSTDARQVMLSLTGVYYFSNDYTPPLGMANQEACVDGCSRNCSCLAAFWRVKDQACHHVDQLGSLRGDLNQTNYLTFLKVDVSRQSDGEASGPSSATIIVVSVVSCVGALLVLLIAFLYWRHKKENETDEEEDAFLDAIPGRPIRFSYEELLKITSGFERQLGKGGFGTVYAGMLSDGCKVAVKKLESIRQGNKEFRAEVAIMGGIHHNNLLKLIGFCARKGHRLLVYEYMENGSLDAWLFVDDAHQKSRLTWNVRCKIAVGTARGLSYLHEDCSEKIIHLDIKPQNILLDEGFEAKVADFGLSRFIDRKDTRVMTTMRGTPGYLAPDWLTEGLIDEKCDVYSFGMLLMEIISGRKNLDHSVESMEKIYYPEWAFWQAQRQDLRKISDANIGTDEDLTQLRRMINTAFICLLEDPTLRPSMSKVVLMLQGDVPIDKLELSSLHQGLLFVLKNPSSFTRAQIEQTVQELLGPESSTFSVDSFAISTR